MWSKDMTAIPAPRLGSTVETAIVIIAEDSAHGLRIEEMFLRQLFGERHEFVTQVLISHKGRSYDRITVLTEGRRESVYFDISSFHSVKLRSVAPRPRNPPEA